MDNKNQIDNIWEYTLRKEVQKIDVPEDLLDKIKLNKGHEKNIRMTIKNDIKELFCPFQLNTLRIGFTAAMCIFFLAAQFLIFSENARVFALDSINNAFTLVYRIVGYESGEYKIEKIPLEEAKWFYQDSVFYADNYIEQTVGFSIFMPEALSDGYNAFSGRNIYAAEGKSGNKDYMVSTIYSNSTGSHTIVLETAKDRENYFFSEMYNTKHYKIVNKDVLLGECPYLVHPGSDPRQQPIDLNVIQVFLWENNGVHYRLWSTNNDLSIDKGLKLVEEIINNKCPVNTEFKNTGDRYGKNDIANNEIRNMVGYPVKIPDKLNKGFSLEYKTVSTITEYGQTGQEVCGYYEKDSRHLKISIIKMGENISFLKNDPSTEVIKIGDIEYYWYEQNTPEWIYKSENFLEFKIDGINYFLSILDGSFASKEEAISIAESILESN